MPRLARIDAPGVDRVMIQGIERRKIFLNDKDREDMLDRLAKLLPETETACYAWVFLENHAHFLVRTGRVPLSTLMRKLLTGYAVRFKSAKGGSQSLRRTFSESIPRLNEKLNRFNRAGKSIVCQVEDPPQEERSLSAGACALYPSEPGSGEDCLQPSGVESISFMN